MMNHSAEVTIGTEADFFKWLNVRRDKRVGYAGRTGSCPLANWLRSLNPGRRIHVLYRFGVVEAVDQDDPAAGAGWRLPQWAADFADDLDTVAPTAPGYRDVDGEYALSFLVSAGE